MSTPYDNAEWHVSTACDINLGPLVAQGMFESITIDEDTIAAVLAEHDPEHGGDILFRASTLATLNEADGGYDTVGHTTYGSDTEEEAFDAQVDVAVHTSGADLGELELWDEPSVVQAISFHELRHAMQYDDTRLHRRELKRERQLEKAQAHVEAALEAVDNVLLGVTSLAVHLSHAKLVRVRDCLEMMAYKGLPSEKEAHAFEAYAPHYSEIITIK